MHRRLVVKHEVQLVVWMILSLADHSRKLAFALGPDGAKEFL